MLVPSLVLLLPALATPVLAEPTSLRLLRHDRRLVKRDAAAVSIASEAFVNYHVNITVGTPPQELRVMLANTNDLMILHSCDDPPGQSSEMNCPTMYTFNSSASSTYVNDNKTIENVPFNANDTAILTQGAHDQVTLGGNTINATFLHYGGGPLRNFAHGFHWQGLLGLDPGESLAGGQTFMKALSQKWSEPTIGIYLAAHTQQVGQYEQYDNTSSITDVGELSLGGVNKSLYTGDITYMNTSNTSRWTVPLDSIKFGGETIETKDIFMSPAFMPTVSSEFTWLPPQVIDAIYGKIPGAKKATATAKNEFNQTYYQMPCNVTDAVTLVFGGVEYAVNASDWVQPLNMLIGGTDGQNTTGLCTGTFISTDSLGGDPLTPPYNLELGASFLRSVYTVLKFGDQPQVGFAKLAPGLRVINADAALQSAGNHPTGSKASEAIAAASSTPPPAGSTPTSTPKSAAGRNQVAIGLLVGTLGALALF